MADIIPHNLFYRMAKGEVDLEDDTTYVSLIDDTYTPDADDTNFTTGSDPYDSELETNYGYTQRTEEVTFTVTDDDTNDLCKVDCTDASWTADGGAIGPTRYAVFWDSTATDDPIIYILDFGSNQTANDGADFDITIDADGLFEIAQA